MIELLVILIVAGVLLWLLNQLVPMDPKVKLVINVLVGLFLFLYVLSAFGLFNMPALRR